MSSPTQNAIVNIVNQVSGHLAGGYTSNNDIQINNYLNGSNFYPNPVPAGQVYGTYDSSTLIAMMPTGLLNTFMYIPDFGDVIIPLWDTPVKTSGIIKTITNWFVRCSGAQIITPAVYLGAINYFNQTFTDPTWSSGVSWSQFNLGRSTDLSDIAISRGYYDVLVGIPPTGIL